MWVELGFPLRPVSEPSMASGPPCWEASPEGPLGHHSPWELMAEGSTTDPEFGDDLARPLGGSHPGLHVCVSKTLPFETLLPTSHDRLTQGPAPRPGTDPLEGFPGRPYSSLQPSDSALC